MLRQKFHSSGSIIFRLFLSKLKRDENSSRSFQGNEFFKNNSIVTKNIWDLLMVSFIWSLLELFLLMLKFSSSSSMLFWVPKTFCSHSLNMKIFETLGKTPIQKAIQSEPKKKEIIYKKTSWELSLMPLIKLIGFSIFLQLRHNRTSDKKPGRESSKNSLKRWKRFLNALNSAQRRNNDFKNSEKSWKSFYTIKFACFTIVDMKIFFHFALFYQWDAEKCATIIKKEEFFSQLELEGDENCGKWKRQWIFRHEKTRRAAKEDKSKFTFLDILVAESRVGKWRGKKN